MTAPPMVKHLTCSVAELTSRGRGAVATVAVHGSNAIELVGRLFSAVNGQPLSLQPAGRIVFGQWRSAQGEDIGEELIVCCHGPSSVEIHCHGGQAASERIVRSLESQGCRRVDASHFVRSHSEDQLVSDAHLALSEATTDRVAAVLMDQYRGSLSCAVRNILQLIEAARAAEALDVLQTLNRFSVAGRRLLTPARIVLAGKPNTGKSSLVNAVLGYQRSIVHGQSGTTRDVLVATTAIDGWPVQIVDTAGLATVIRDPVETEGVLRAHAQIGLADVVLLVTDVVSRWTREEIQLHRAVGDRVVLVLNKVDLACPARGAWPRGYTTSARTGEGIDRLLQAVSRHLVAETPPAGSAIPFLDRHFRAISRAISAIQQNDLQGARQAMLRMQRAE